MLRTRHEVVITEQTLVEVTDNLAIADLEGESVILEPNTSRYYGLNEVGTQILDLSRRPVKVQDIIESLQAKYTVEREKLKEDVIGFIRELRESQIIRIHDRE